MYNNLFLTVADGVQQPDMLQQILTLVLPIGAFGLIFYFLIYRPQKKQEKSVNEMRSALKVGDEISTTGGILGRVVKIKDDFVIIETGSDRNKITIAKWSIRAIEHSADSEEE